MDKYAATVFLVADQQGGSYPAQVHARLFDRVHFDARLAPEQYDRYRTAHRCAANYCRRLESRFVSRGEAQVEALGTRTAQVLSLGEHRQAAARARLSAAPGRRGRYSSVSRLLLACFFSASHSLNFFRSFLRGGSVFPSRPLS